MALSECGLVQGLASNLQYAVRLKECHFCDEAR